MSGRPPKLGKGQRSPKPIHTAEAPNPEPPKASLLEEIRDEHGAMKSVESGYREERRKRLAHAVELGLKLAEASRKIWDSFVADPRWGNRKPKTPKQSEAVRCVVLWSYASDKRGTKQASDVWRAVKHLRGEDKSAADIVETIRTGPSIRALCDKAAKQAKLASGSAAAPPEAEKVTSPAAKHKPAHGDLGDRPRKSTTDRDARSSKKKAQKTPLAAAPTKGTPAGNLGVRSGLSQAQSDADVTAKLRFRKNASELTCLPKNSRVRIDAVIEKIDGDCVLRVRSCRPRPKKSKSIGAPKAPHDKV